MDLQKIGAFLAALRKEQGLTQEQLGEKIGVTNKTVSRWEKGNYLPPAEMLKVLSELYSVSINELLSGERLAAEEYQEKAEKNITAAISGKFTGRDWRGAAGEWLRRRWWTAVLCLAPAAVLFGAMPTAVSGGSSLFLHGVSVLVTGLMILVSHLVFHVSGRAYQATKREDAYGAARVIRVVFLILLGVMLFVSLDLLLATIHSLTPAGRADGYAIRSMFYDILIRDGGIYPDNCFNALEWSLRQTFFAAMINLDLTVLWMKK